MPDNQSSGLFRVRFIPGNLEVIARDGDILLDTVRTANLRINPSCGGQGVCGTCRVKIVKGFVDSTVSDKISAAEYEDGVRLACQSRIKSDLIVEIPLESSSDKAVQARERPISAAAPSVSWKFDPPLKKFYLELPAPTQNDNANDLFRLLSGLERGYQIKEPRIDFEVIRKLSAILRKEEFRVTVTVLDDLAGTETGNSFMVIDIEAGDTRQNCLAVAVDIGTTTICSQLLDLNNAKVVADTIIFNKQRAYGDDVITRIVHSQKPEGLDQLQRAVVASINETIDLLVDDSRLDRKHIGYVTVAGNTVMQMLLLGLCPKYIRLSPYVTTTNFMPLVKATSLGLNVPEQAYLFTFPAVSSYVGGDIVSGVIAAGVHQSEKLTFYMDIGTNGEIVVGNSEWLVTASCSAGPAFEGGGIKHGMVAMKGAIQDFSIDKVTLEPKIKTIGDVPAKGICGSGLINAIADLLTAGVIDRNGKYKTGFPSPRIRQGSDGWEYVLSWASETQIGRDIVITEVDISNLLRAKAAMYAGCHTLTRKVNVDCVDFERVILAGNFGSSLNVEKAITIGLLPDIPREKFSFVGNGSLSGARLVGFSIGMLNDSRRVAKMMTNIELSEDHDFINNYMAALFLPHTDDKAFPSVLKKLG